LQYFGSTVSRFQQETQATKDLGPGSYEIKSRKPPIGSVKYGFNSGENRWQKSVSLKNFTESKQEPGPGSYQVLSHLKKVVGKNGVFGSTERRFVQNEEQLKTPGPG
jgi:hypothetical protein